MAEREKRNGKLKINISGTIFIVNSDITNGQNQRTPLASLSKDSPYYDANEEAFCFSRDPDVFYSVLNFFRYGELHLPKFLCGNMIKYELEFWGIDICLVSECCAWLLHDKTRRTDGSKSTQMIGKQSDTVDEHPPLPLREKIWLTLDNPEFSLLSKIWSHLYTCVLLLHASVFIIWNEKIVRVSAYLTNQRFAEEYASEKLQRFLVMDPSIGTVCLAVLCSAFFTLEIIMRFIVCPNKIQFVLNPRNGIDVCLQIISWFVLIIELSLDITTRGRPLINFYLFCTGLNSVRLVLMFRATKSNKLLFTIIRETWKDLCALLLLFFVGVIIFGTMIYYSEMYHADIYPTIFDSLWWSIVSMTTVGYSDTYPLSVLGRVFGCLSVISGVLVITMAVAIVVVKYIDNPRSQRL